MTSSFWDERYASPSLVYGDAPNEFLASVADRLPTRGVAIDLGAGQGRNAIFLAKHGLDVLAIDQSRVGLECAQELARSRGVTIRTAVADLAQYRAAPGSLDVISSIFCHLPSAIRTPLYASLGEWLRPGGVLVMEAYTPAQLRRDTGGPKDPDMLPPLATLTKELTNLRFHISRELVRTVVEGDFHKGEADVLQILATKA